MTVEDPFDSIIDKRRRYGYYISHGGIYTSVGMPPTVANDGGTE